MSKVKGLQLVLERNQFYRDNYRQACLALVLLIVLNVALFLSITIKILNPLQPRYFATTTAGKIITLHPLTDKTVSDGYVLQWTADQVRRAFSQDYIHWRDQLSDVSSSFTPNGWRAFLSAMKSTNNLSTLVQLKMVSNAKVTGAPVIARQLVVGGHYVWDVKLPILVTYQNADKTIPMPLEVNILVIRMPVQDYPQRIAINNFIPVISDKEQAQLESEGL